MRAGDLRQRVNVMRPPEATGKLGQTQGKPSVIYRDWHCSIKPLSGTESIEGQQVVAGRTFEVEGRGDPANPIKEIDYLTEGTLGKRILNVAMILDEHQNGVGLRLVCGEKP